MKKIAALLAMATVLTTSLVAEVSWGGWLETKGDITTLVNDDLDDDAKKPMLGFGATTLDLTLNYYGDGFGATSTLETWAGRNGQWSSGYGASPAFLNTYIWSNVLPMTTLYAGINMWPISYTPAPVVEGGLFFNDGFGRGMGAYNYQANGNGYTKGISGLIAEVKVAGLSFAFVSNTADIGKSADDSANTYLVEDVVKDNLIFNAKYDAGIVTAYAGYAMQEDNGGLWLAASTNIMEGLIADVKYETNLAAESEDQAHMVALNLGYSMDAAKVVSEINLDFVDDGGVDGAKTMGWDVALRATPYVVPVVDLSVDVALSGNNAEESDVNYGFGANIGKGVGNVGNTLRIGYSSNSNEDAIGSFVVGYAISMWF